MRDQDDWLTTVRGLLLVIGASDVTEFQYQGRGLRLRLQRRPGAGLGAAPAGLVAESIGDLHVLAAPLTGVFYAAPSPQSDPYVREGDWLEAGTVVGLIETMKIFNEVAADLPGRLVRAHVIPGQLVHQGEALFSIDPRASAPGLEGP